MQGILVPALRVLTFNGKHYIHLKKLSQVSGRNERKNLRATLERQSLSDKNGMELTDFGFLRC